MSEEDLFQMLADKDEEIERLNNIINELEEWLIKIIEDNEKTINNNKDLQWEIIQKETYLDRIMILNCILDKLRELKGSDSNEQRY